MSLEHAIVSIRGVCEAAATTTAPSLYYPSLEFSAGILASYCYSLPKNGR